MAYQPFKLSGKDQSKLKQALDDLAAIEADIERAKEANTPNMDSLLEVCNGKRECIEKLRKAYASNSK